MSGLDVLLMAALTFMWGALWFKIGKKLSKQYDNAGFLTQMIGIIFMAGPVVMFIFLVSGAVIFSAAAIISYLCSFLI